MLKKNTLTLFLISTLISSCAQSIPQNTITMGKKVTKNPTNLVNRPLNKIVTPSASPKTNYEPINPTSITDSTSDIKEVATFNGKIVDRKGNPAIGAKVYAKAIDPGVTWSSEEQVSSNGSYVFRNAPLGARLQITVEQNGIKRTRTEVLKSNLTGDPTANKFDFDGIYSIDKVFAHLKFYDENGKPSQKKAKLILESQDKDYPFNYTENVVQQTVIYAFPANVLVKVTVKYDDKEKSKLVKISEDRSIINFGGNNPEDKDFSISSLKVKADSQEIAAGVNPFIPTEQQKLSTFATDVDTASYTLMRNSVVSAGSIPSKDSVRIEEYLNYFNYNYEKPTKAKFSIHTDLVPSIFGKDPNKKILRVGIQGKEIKIENRKSAVLTFVVDTSGSMSEKNKLEIIKSSLKIFLKQMTSKDKISIVSYSEKATTLLDNATLEQEAKILEVINSLKATTSTNIEAGLKEGYKIAQKNFVSGAINRILLCSDGVSNLGVNKPQELLKLTKDQSEVGINLSTIGVGFENVNDQFLESLANNGDGFYAYIDSVKEAIKVFVENSTDTLQVIAKDTKIQVDFNPKTVKYYRLIGYEDKLLASTDFRNDKVDAGEIGPNHSVTALYEIFLNEENTKKAEGKERIADLTLRFKDVDLQNTPLEVTKEVSLKDLTSDFTKSSSSLKLALAVALYGEILRGSYWKANNSFQDVLKLINELDETSKNDERVLEFKSIVEKAIEIYK